MVDYLKKSSNQANWDGGIQPYDKVKPSESFFHTPSLEDLPSQIVELSPEKRERFLEEFQKESLLGRPPHYMALRTLLSPGNWEQKASIIKNLWKSLLT